MGLGAGLWSRTLATAPSSLPVRALVSPGLHPLDSGLHPTGTQEETGFQSAQGGCYIVTQNPNSTEQEGEACGQLKETRSTSSPYQDGQSLPSTTVHRDQASQRPEEGAACGREAESSACPSCYLQDDQGELLALPTWPPLFLTKQEEHSEAQLADR